MSVRWKEARRQYRRALACDDRPGLKACLADLRRGDVLVVWKLGRRPRTSSGSSSS